MNISRNGNKYVINGEITLDNAAATALYRFMQKEYMENDIIEVIEEEYPDIDLENVPEELIAEILERYEKYQGNSNSNMENCREAVGEFAAQLENL